MNYTTFAPELSKRAQADTPFFSPLPRHVYTLREKGTLKSRDVEVLGLLLDYKNAATTTVCPSHDEMKKRLGCSHDTIARSLTRLKQSGLVIAERLRDLRGRWGKWVYDLAAVFTHLPAQSAVRTGQYGEAGEAKKQSSTQVGGVSKVYDCSVKADKEAGTSTQAELSPEAATLVVEIASQGAEEKMVREMVQKHGANRAREVLALAKQQRGKIRCFPAWLRMALKNGWGMSAESGEKTLSALPGAATEPRAVSAALPPACQPYRPAWERGAEVKESISGGDRQMFQDARAWLKQKGGRL